MVEWIDRSQASCDCRIAFEWDKWMKKIPAISFPADWKIQIIPPFGGAIIRFVVDNGSGKTVSVYLDAYDQLGCMGMQPYWEIYPDETGDCARFYMNETNELLLAIYRSFESENKSE